MSFILKPNNRKIRSGSTIQAKIVSPDKKDFATKQYAVLVQTQSLSAYDRVMRDAQQVGALLDINDWTNITTSIENLNAAKLANSNGTIITGPEWTNTSSNGITYINKNGVVNTRPKYDPEADVATSAHVAKLKFKVEYEDAFTYVEREFVIPAYTADDVLAVIRNAFDTDTFWNIVKGSNRDKNYIFTNLATVSNVSSTLQNSCGIDISDYVNTEVSGAIPTVTFSSDSEYIGTNNTYARPTAKAVYGSLDRDDYQVVALLDRNLNAYTTDLVVDDTHLAKGQLVAYQFKAIDTDNNKLTATWELGGESFTKSIDLQFVSGTVKNSEIKANIEASEHTGWFIPDQALTEYSLTSVECTNTTASTDRIEITIPTGKNVVLKLPKVLTDLLSDTENDQILDDQNIGYSLDSSRTLRGFTNDMYSFTVAFDGVNAYTSNSIPNFTSALNPSEAGASSFSSGNYNAETYIYIPKESFTTDITGSFSLVPYETTLPTTGDPRTNSTIFFTLKKGS